MPIQHMPDLRLLQRMVAIADTGSIAGAARALNLAQPALSRSLAELEAAVGHPLFTRAGRGARPTEAGALLVDGARSLLTERDRLIHEVRRRATGETGTLAIAFNETVSWSGVMPAVLRAFRVAHPDVRLTALPLTSGASKLALLERRAALAFMFGRSEADTLFAALPISREPIMLAVHRDDPLARLPEPVRLEQLAGAPFVWFERGASPAYHDQVLAALAEAGVVDGPAQLTTNTSAMLALVNVGAGYTLVPAGAQGRKPEEVVLRALDWPQGDQRLELVWLAEDESALTRRFVACARTILEHLRRPWTEDVT